MSDDMTPSDVEPNGVPCRVDAVIVLDQYRKLGSGEHTLSKLKAQFRAIEAKEHEIERKKQVQIDIAHLREKIKDRGEIPCA